jgi:4-hydroxybenzoate polyprenyltransferase
MKPKELWAFFVHLRPHYQLLILPGGYLLGGLYAETFALRPFVGQFFVVHLLLNGGVTAYNSYHDKDEGPIGGLAHPPKMTPWMLPASIVVQLVGLALIASLGELAINFYLSTMLLSVLYSSPRFRWKGKPLLSLVAVGIGTGTNTFWLGYLAASGQGTLTPRVVVGGFGVAATLLSLYPVSQVFQLEEDRRRGDRTFASAFGLPGVRRFFFGAYALGVALLTLSLVGTRPAPALVFGIMAVAGGALSGWTIARLRGEASEYRAVMRLKYMASLGFVLYTVAWLGVLWGPPSG